MSTDVAPDSCVVCGGSRFSVPSRCDRLIRCDACGLLLRPRQDHEKLDEAFYEQQHFESMEADWIEGRRRVFADEIVRLAPFRQTGRVLDVGAGHGFFLSACRDAGWQATGIEIGQRPAVFARSHFDLEIIETPIETAALPEGAFDVVTFWNVLDQVPDPRSALLAAVRALRPGGLLLVRCPNAAFHLRIRQLARSLAAIVPAAGKLDGLTVFHLYSFPPPVLRRLFHDVGLHSTEIAAAPLSWTQGAADQIGLGKRLLRKSIFAGALALQAVSGGRLQCCPSVVARAIKA